MSLNVLTRKEYLELNTQAQPNSTFDLHHDYFKQFVTVDTIEHVNNRFTTEELTRALEADKHLNSIRLDDWNDLTWDELANGMFKTTIPVDNAKLKAAGEIISRAILVCIAKTAARMIVNGETVVKNHNLTKPSHEPKLLTVAVRDSADLEHLYQRFESIDIELEPYYGTHDYCEEMQSLYLFDLNIEFAAQESLCEICHKESELDRITDAHIDELRGA